ncbi:beta-defensin 1 [Strix aluco]|uniref:Beta-defensin-like domain-containing protein n=1 Tax=Strix occidentalis caurina TaxID=311401 RepID=A0A8D0F6J5_STROC
MSAKAMKVLLLLLLLLPAVSQAAAVADTVTCRKTKGKCSFLLCPLFMRATGTCYNRLAKCCRPLW